MALSRTIPTVVRGSHCEDTLTAEAEVAGAEEAAEAAVVLVAWPSL